MKYDLSFYAVVAAAVGGIFAAIYAENVVVVVNVGRAAVITQI